MIKRWPHCTRTQSIQCRERLCGCLGTLDGGRRKRLATLVLSTTGRLKSADLHCQVRIGAILSNCHALARNQSSLKRDTIRDHQKRKTPMLWIDLKLDAFVNVFLYNNVVRTSAFDNGTKESTCCWRWRSRDGTSFVMSLAV